MLYIGIDLGTSNVKLLLADKSGNILRQVSRDYSISFPRSGWAEQNPDDWWNAVKDGINELTKDVDKTQIAGIGCGGQMHGLVILDSCDKVIRPVILWNDNRTDKQVQYLNNTVGKEAISKMTANIAFAGFTAPKLLWLYENEPENFAKISKIMLPKDYINYQLTGVHCCDYSDASGMLLLDIQHKCWSSKMLEICHVSTDMLPKLFESYEVVGTLTDSAAEKLGLLPGIKVVAGAGDNAAAAIGTATIGSGKCNISLGTSGTIFMTDKNFRIDPYNALHSFAHADGGYHLMGVALCAASCNKWFCDNILETTDYANEQKDITDEHLGRNEVFFLPYLMGERSPVNDTNARGVFIGMNMNTKRCDLIQAVLEGVAFAIRDSFEVAKALGIDIERSNICGGGTKSPLWKKIFANVLGIPMDTVVTEQGAGYGAAMLAMVGSGAYSSVEECAEHLVHIKDSVLPDPEIAKRYEHKYQQFKKIYPSWKELFTEIK